MQYIIQNFFNMVELVFYWSNGILQLINKELCKHIVGLSNAIIIILLWFIFIGVCH